MDELTAIANIATAIGGSVFLTKLAEVVSGAVGKAWEPTHVRRIADANKDARITEANTNAEIALIEQQADFKRQEMAIRCGERLFKAEMRRQKNIEAIIAKAAQEKPADADVAQESPSEDWIVNFFESCKDISNEKMQKLWAKLLAGEVAVPGSFSMRTLQCVKTLEPLDAILFKAICGYAWQGDTGPMLIYPAHPGTTNYLDPDLQFGQLNHLENIGLVKTSSNSAEYLTAFDEDRYPIVYFGRQFVFDPSKRARNVTRVIQHHQKKHVFPCGHVMFTDVGKQLCPLSGAEPVEGYVEKARAYIESAGGSFVETTGASDEK